MARYFDFHARKPSYFCGASSAWESPLDASFCISSEKGAGISDQSTGSLAGIDMPTSVRTCGAGESSTGARLRGAERAALECAECVSRQVGCAAPIGAASSAHAASARAASCFLSSIPLLLA